MKDPVSKEANAPYYENLRELKLSPGWARPEPSMWPSPAPKFKPAVWRFAKAKQALDASHNLVPQEQTDRRNLILVNPIAGNTYATTRHLVAAYQCVMPGDMARTHRHSAAALRLVIHGKSGIYTVVNGQRIDMAPGDVVLTPSWSWHGHVNASDETAYWIDFLDIPFIQLTEAVTGNGASPMRYPSGTALGSGTGAHTVEIAKGIMPTIALHLIRQPKGASVAFDKSTSNAIYAVVSGRARFMTEGLDETLGVGDVVAMPCWHSHTIEATDDTVVFKVTDEPIFEKLGLSRTAN